MRDGQLRKHILGLILLDLNEPNYVFNLSDQLLRHDLEVFLQQQPELYLVLFNDGLFFDHLNVLLVLDLHELVNLLLVLQTHLVEALLQGFLGLLVHLLLPLKVID